MQSTKKITTSVGSLVRKLLAGHVSREQKVFIGSSSSLRPPPPSSPVTERTASPAVAGLTASLPGSKAGQAVSATELVGPELEDMFDEIHADLDEELEQDTELKSLSKYYFDGRGKAIRPVIAMVMAHAFNRTLGISNDLDLIAKQKKVAIISEMIHTASLVHDDVIDKADTRRGKTAVNRRWSANQSAVAGDYIIAVSSILIARLRNPDVMQILSNVLVDLVRGEFQQLQTRDNETERFQLYLNKTFNKTASLIAYSCKANAVLAMSSLRGPTVLQTHYDRERKIDRAYQYGRNIGIAFQLVDDLLDFVSSSEQLGKPAAADLKLGLATAPVLFASSKFPELEPMISRRFSQEGDVEAAFEAVLQSDGLDRTRDLAHKHCQEALNSLSQFEDSEYKEALINISDIVINRIK